MLAIAFANGSRLSSTSASEHSWSSHMSRVFLAVVALVGGYKVDQNCLLQAQKHSTWLHGLDRDSTKMLGLFECRGLYWDPYNGLLYIIPIIMGSITPYKHQTNQVLFFHCWNRTISPQLCWMHQQTTNGNDFYILGYPRLVLSWNLPKSISHTNNECLKEFEGFDFGNTKILIFIGRILQTRYP